jgi:TonB family protein
MILAGILLTSIQMNWLVRDDESQQYAQKLEVAVKSGNSNAEVCLGEMKKTALFQKPDSTAALTLFREAADRGNQRAQELIAQMSMRGDGGLKRDTAKALSDFHALIKQGYLSAATDLGVYYLSRENPTESDYKDAMTWFKKGAAGGDPFAAVAIGSMYASGSGVRQNRIVAKQWIDKAADRPIACFTTFMELTDDIIKANVVLPENVDDRTGIFRVIYEHKGGKAVHPFVMNKSNNTAFDKAWLLALKISKLPNWPKNFNPENHFVGLTVATRSYLFRQSLTRAVENALVMPRYVLLHGSKGTGKVAVQFDYLNGKVTHVEIKKSSGDKLEDAAALQAVNDAHYPVPPVEYVNNTIGVMVPVYFYMQAPPGSTKELPAAVLVH